MSCLKETDFTVTSSDSTSKKTKYILLTNGDSYVGHILAVYISDQLMKREGQMKKKHWRLRVLCENKSMMKELEKKGIEVKVICIYFFQIFLFIDFV